METAASLYARNKDAMFAAPILPANVVGMGVSAPSLTGQFRTAAQQAPQNQEQQPSPQTLQAQAAMRGPAQVAQPQQPANDSQATLDRANLAGDTLRDTSQKGMKAQSAAMYLGGQMAEMGKELMTGLFGALKGPEKNDSDFPQRQPQPMAMGMQAPSAF